MSRDELKQLSKSHSRLSRYATRTKITKISQDSSTTFGWNFTAEVDLFLLKSFTEFFLSLEPNWITDWILMWICFAGVSRTSTRSRTKIPARRWWKWCSKCTRKATTKWNEQFARPGANRRTKNAKGRTWAIWTFEVPTILRFYLKSCNFCFEAQMGQKNVWN